MNPLAPTRIPFASLTPEAVRHWVAREGFPDYRAAQLLRWFYRSRASSFSEMTNLPRRLIDQLDTQFDFSTVTPRQRRSADQGETSKYLFELPDGELLESVAMHYARTPGRRERTTVCLSTQVGCAIRCTFCATGLQGLKRNLSTAETIDQVLAVARDSGRQARRVGQLVYMGMGEPLHNLEVTLASLRRFTDSNALGLGVRRVTVSTAGVVPGIDRLALDGGGSNLAISLHAPIDELRDRLVPLNRRWPIAELLAAARRYAQSTGRRVSYEYVMLRGVNDSELLADGLGRLLAGELAHVNLIPYNPIPGDPFASSSPSAIDRFRERVRSHAVECTVRDTRGRRIDAACGQLRAEAGPAARQASSRPVAGELAGLPQN